MKDPAYSIRKAYYDALNTLAYVNYAPVPIYDNIPDNAYYPYIQISNISMTDSSTKDNFNSDCVVTLQIFTGTDGTSYSKKDADEISNSVMEKILDRTNRLDGGSDFNIVTATLEGSSYLETQYDGFFEVRKIIRIRNLVEQK
jgi:hypothetical protein